MILHRRTVANATKLSAVSAYMTADEWAGIHQDYKSEPGSAFRTVMTMCPFTHGTRLFPVQIIAKPRNLRCACCDDDAGRFSQWWNQDTGFGICARCVDLIHDRGPEYLAKHGIDFIDLYGIPGVHRAIATHETQDTKHV